MDDASTRRRHPGAGRVAGCEPGSGATIDHDADLDRDQDRHAAHQRAAVGERAHQGFHQGPELPELQRGPPLRSRRGSASGRGQSRPGRHSRAKLERGLFRQRNPRRRPIFPRPLQHPARRSAQGPDRDDLRARRRRRHHQPRAQGSRRRPGQGSHPAGRLVLRRARRRGRGPGLQRELGRPLQRRLREHRQLPQVREHRTLRRQSAGRVCAERQHQDRAELRIFPRQPRLIGIRGVARRNLEALPDRPLDILRQSKCELRQCRCEYRDGGDRARLRFGAQDQERLALRQLRQDVPERLSGRRGQCGGNVGQPDRIQQRNRPPKSVQSNRPDLQAQHRIHQANASWWEPKSAARAG